MAAFLWVSIGEVVLIIVITFLMIKIGYRLFYMPDRPNLSASELRQKITHRFIVIMFFVTLILIGMNAAILL